MVRYDLICISKVYYVMKEYALVFMVSNAVDREHVIMVLAYVIKSIVVYFVNTENV